MIRNLDELVLKAKERGKRKLAVAFAQDSHTLEAVNDAVQAGIADAILIGDPSEIEKVCAEQGINYKQFTIIAESSDVKCVEKAVKMVREGEADVLMKGLVSTDKYMRGILSKDFGLVPPKGVLSHVTVLQIPTYHKLLVVGDVAVIPYPDIKQKTAIVKYIVQTSKLLGVEVPKVACLAPSEQLLPAIPSSVEAALIAKMGERGQLGVKVDIDGPLALDVAIDPEAVKTKKLVSAVAGDADCMLFPNIDAGNVFFKTTTKFCGAQLAGLVMGASNPCVLTSRGDSRETKLYSIALGCLMAK